MISFVWLSRTKALRSLNVEAKVARSLHCWSSLWKTYEVALQPWLTDLKVKLRVSTEARGFKTVHWWQNSSHSSTKVEVKSTAFPYGDHLEGNCDRSHKMCGFSVSKHERQQQNGSSRRPSWVLNSSLRAEILTTLHIKLKFFLNTKVEFLAWMSDSKHESWMLNSRWIEEPHCPRKVES